MKKNPKESIKKDKLLSLFTSEIQDMLDAEEQIIKALPAMIKAAECGKLKEAFSSHLQETKNQAKRLEQVCHMIGLREKGESCEAMEGLIEECNHAINEHPKSALRDAALIAKAQRIEHYEISVYGTLKTFAQHLGLKEAVTLLQESQNEEVNADKILTKIAEGGLLATGINQQANDE